MAALAASPDDPARDWSRFARLLVVCACALFLLGFGFLLLVDPYDTGRTGVFGRGLHDQYPFTANASRARDPRFDAAILGNSHVQALRPGRLDALTGLRFVSLIMPATYASDTLDTLRWYLIAHRTPPRAIVIGVDEHWCIPTIRTNTLRFPTWLYSPSGITYATGLARYRSFEAALMRLSYLVTRKNGLRPDGYWYYGPIYAQQGLDGREPSYRKLAETRPFPANPDGPFPLIDRLRAELPRIPPSTLVLMVRTPMYRTALPAPGSAAERTAAECAARIEAVAAARPHTAFLDLLKPGPDADDRDNFYDHDHYRDRLAVGIETALATALKDIGLPPPEPRT